MSLPQARRAWIAARPFGPFDKLRDFVKLPSTRLRVCDRAGSRSHRAWLAWIATRMSLPQSLAGLDRGEDAAPTGLGSRQECRSHKAWLGELTVQRERSHPLGDGITEKVEIAGRKRDRTKRFAGERGEGEVEIGGSPAEEGEGASSLRPDRQVHPGSRRFRENPHLSEGPLPGVDGIGIVAEEDSERRPPAVFGAILDAAPVGRDARGGDLFGESAQDLHLGVDPLRELAVELEEEGVAEDGGGVRLFRPAGAGRKVERRPTPALNSRERTPFAGYLFTSRNQSEKETPEARVGDTLRPADSPLAQDDGRRIGDGARGNREEIALVRAGTVGDVEEEEVGGIALAGEGEGVADGDAPDGPGFSPEPAAGGEPGRQDFFKAGELEGHRGRSSLD